METLPQWSMYFFLFQNHGMVCLSLKEPDARLRLIELKGFGVSLFGVGSELLRRTLGHVVLFVAGQSLCWSLPPSGAMLT